jgi:hypothetical protein
VQRRRAVAGLPARLERGRAAWPLAAAAGVAAALLLAMTGCSAEQTVTIRPGAAGTAGTSDIDLVLSDFLVSYIRDLSASVGVETDAVFEAEAVRASLAGIDTVKLQRVEVPAANRLRLRVSFEDLGEALAGTVAPGTDPGTTPLTVTESGGRTHMVLRLTPEVLDAVIDMSPWRGTLMAEILLPPDRTAMSGDEYIEYLTWALEEYEDPRVVRRALEEAAVDVLVRVPGEVVDQRGGEVADGGVRYRLPVVDLVTLSDAQRFDLWYR